MTTNIFIVYNNDLQVQRIKETQFKESLYLQFIDSRTRKGKNAAWKLKNEFGARLDPFIVIYDNDKPIKAFYTEADVDVVESLIKYLNE